MRQKTFVKYFEVMQSKQNQNTLLQPRKKNSALIIFTFTLCTSIRYGTYERGHEHLQNSWSHQFCAQRVLSMPSALPADWNLAGLEQGYLVWACD